MLVTTTLKIVENNSKTTKSKDVELLNDPILLVGQKIRKLRKQLGITQRELARRVGLKPERISRIESKQKYTTNETLTKIAEALGVPLSHLLETDSPSTHKHPDPKIQSLLETLDVTTQQFVTEEDVDELEKALQLSIEMVRRLKGTK